MSKKILIIGMVIMLSFTVLSCTKKKEASDSNNDKVKVMVSIYPLKEFTEAIGKDKVEVKALVPEGSEPHDFDPKPKDLEALNKTEIFVYNGLGMEEWIDKVLGTIENKNSVNHVDNGIVRTEVVDSSLSVNTIKTDGKLDPHIWLSLKEAKIQALNIKNALVKVDAKNKDFYEGNYKEFTKSIDEVIEKNTSRFNNLNNKDFVTSHAAFGYLCRDFGLEQKSAQDVFGEGELTPQKLKEIVEFTKKYNIKTIFMENSDSAKVSETLAKEVGGKVQKIYTLENKEDNKNYIEAMKNNLDNIYESLK
ncbi:zinc transport system substrate-binding protein [Clostridium cavendishii DSM 21758]|uniref:Zinc transport system substrate-binding protein n=1 Tax=Clostridium cavendishii DSM 21758 TaxID=1121302 RepID=A0A1M6UDI3_9CLOT|nr:zinc ABC transporter substrate-binding protein [Clostridium cavendishii]SHK67227.1 zinc transport system substrate-binding protein [Clostridium cavendishii DSM 21758]